MNGEFYIGQVTRLRTVADWLDERAIELHAAMKVAHWDGDEAAETGLLMEWGLARRWFDQISTELLTLAEAEHADAERRRQRWDELVKGGVP